MSRARMFRTIALVFSLAFLLAAPLAAQTYTAIYVFGDSYSDVGNDFYLTSLYGHPTPPSPPYYAGRFTNGPLWIEHLAGAHGLVLTPSAEGGTDYAFGGAELLAPVTTPYGPIPSVIQQVDEYLLAHRGKADPGALYVLTGGGNDILNAIGTGASSYVLGAEIGTGLGALELLLKRAGAKHFLVPNLIDVGQLPAAAADPGFAKAATLEANDVLRAIDADPLYTAGVELSHPNVYRLFTAIATDPTHFGYSNITVPCLNLTTGLPCSDATHLWWDAEHPTEEGHALFAALADASLP